MSLDVIQEKKIGTEKFVGMDRDINIVDYWSFAHSDLLLNIERGKLAEFIVATAVNRE